jgi:hypothetical protein
MQSTVKTLAVGIALIGLAGGCVSLTGRTAGTTIDNKKMEASVKSKLAADRLRNLTWVDVDANEGVVYLTGNAATPEDKARATEIAMRAKGVTRVVNDIVVNTERGAGADARRSAAPAASPASAPGAVTGDVVSVDPGSGNVTLRMPDGNTTQLRLPPASVRDLRPGDRLSVSVSPVAR